MRGSKMWASAAAAIVMASPASAGVYVQLVNTANGTPTPSGAFGLWDNAAYGMLNRVEFAADVTYGVRALVFAASVPSPTATATFTGTSNFVVSANNRFYDIGRAPISASSTRTLPSLNGIFDFPVTTRVTAAYEGVELAPFLGQGTAYTQGPGLVNGRITQANFDYVTLQGREGFNNFATFTLTYFYDGDFNLYSVPEPTSWAMLIAGFGAIGGSLRRQRSGERAALA